MKAYRICYHTDEDGLASAAVIYEYLKRINNNNNSCWYDGENMAVKFAFQVISLRVLFINMFSTM